MKPQNAPKSVQMIGQESRAIPTNSHTARQPNNTAGLPRPREPTKATIENNRIQSICRVRESAGRLTSATVDDGGPLEGRSRRLNHRTTAKMVSAAAAVPKTSLATGVAIENSQPLSNVIVILSITEFYLVGRRDGNGACQVECQLLRAERRDSNLCRTRMHRTIFRRPATSAMTRTPPSKTAIRSRPDAF